MVIQKGPLFRLPRELRNQITAYVLIPGIVYIKPLRLPSCDASRHAKEEPHSAVLGFGYLATCQQAYEEGHQMFYSQNTFFLPPGWLLYTQCWERDLRSEHRGLIQSLGIGMGLLDIQSQEFCDCDAVTGPSSGRPERTLWANDIDRFLEHDGEIMTESAHMFIEATGVGEMRGMWQEKLRWMRACDWDSVQEMVVANETSKVAFRRDLLPSKINISEDTDDEKLDELLNSATESVTAVIGAGLDALSNADTEAWVEAGAPLGVYGAQIELFVSSPNLGSQAEAHESFVTISSSNYASFKMTPTKRGKGHPKKQVKRKRSSKVVEKSQTPGGGIFTTQAWTSIKRQDRRILQNYSNISVPGRLTLFGLPAEIRNQIFGYLFPPHKANVKKPKIDNTGFISRNSPAWSLVLKARSLGRAKISTDPHPGKALLLTCQRAYEECRLHYYRNTIFFLAPGDIANTIDLAKVVQPANLELITSIGITCDGIDFGPKEYESLQKSYSITSAAKLYRLHTTSGTWPTALDLLRAIWYKKLEWFHRHSWPSLREIHLEKTQGTMFIDVKSLLRRFSLAELAQSQGYPRDPELRAFLQKASLAANWLIKFKVTRFWFMSSKKRKQWVAAGCVEAAARV